MLNYEKNRLLRIFYTKVRLHAILIDAKILEYNNIFIWLLGFNKSNYQSGELYENSSKKERSEYIRLC